MRRSILVLAPALAIVALAAAAPRAAESPPTPLSVKEAPRLDVPLVRADSLKVSPLELSVRLVRAFPLEVETAGASIAVLAASRALESSRSRTAHRNPVRTTGAGSLLASLADTNSLDPGRCTRARYARGARLQV